MDVAVGAAEPCACHADLARAYKVIGGLAGTAVQRGGRCDELEYTAGLVQVADGLVAPLGLLGLLQGGAALLTGQGIHRRAGIVIDEPPGRVGVVVRLAAHRQHSPRLHIHHNAHAPLGHMVLLHGGGEGAFQPVLNFCVDGQRQTVAGHGLLQGLVVGGHVVAPGVFGR